MKWFSERILPPLTVGLIGVFGGYLLGLFSAIADSSVNFLAQRWIPDGTMLLRAISDANASWPECPTGWAPVGRINLLTALKDIGSFDNYFDTNNPWMSTNMKAEGNRALAMLCLKEGSQ